MPRMNENGYERPKLLLQSVENYCFSLSIMQIRDVEVVVICLSSLVPDFCCKQSHVRKRKKALAIIFNVFPPNSELVEKLNQPKTTVPGQSTEHDLLWRSWRIYLLSFAVEKWKSSWSHRSSDQERLHCSHAAIIEIPTVLCTSETGRHTWVAPDKSFVLLLLFKNHTSDLKITLRTFYRFFMYLSASLLVCLSTKSVYYLKLNEFGLWLF